MFDDLGASHRFQDFKLLGVPNPEQPQYETLQKINQPDSWCSFQHQYSETQQWTSESPENEVELGFCIRLHSSPNKVEVISTGRQISNDLFPWSLTTLEGTWEEEEDGTYLLDLKKTNDDRSCYQDDIKDTKYRAGYFGHKLCLERIVENDYDYGREDRFYDVLPVGSEDVWLGSLDNDPLAESRAELDADREESTQSFEKSNKRREQHYKDSGSGSDDEMPLPAKAPS